MNAKEERTTAGKHMILSLLAEEKKAVLVLRKAAEGSKEREARLKASAICARLSERWHRWTRTRR